MTWQHISQVLLHATALRSLIKGTVHALVAGCEWYLIVYLIERAAGASTKQNRGQGFLQDAAYWFYYRSGLDQLLFMSAIFGFLEPRRALLQFHFLVGFNPIVQGIAFFVLSDFCNYWVHRLQHASPFVWAFHSTHHAQEQPSFATVSRFHPVDHFIANLLVFLPLFLLGATPMSWLPIYLATDAMSILLHSRIPWRLGLLSRIFVTPRFHSFHHSTDPRHFNKNFGGLLSVWDHIFGTAVDAAELPTEYGLTEIKMPTLLSTLSVPFQLLHQTYAPAWSKWIRPRSVGSESVSPDEPPPV